MEDAAINALSPEWRCTRTNSSTKCRQMLVLDTVPNRHRHARPRRPRPPLKSPLPNGNVVVSTVTAATCPFSDAERFVERATAHTASGKEGRRRSRQSAAGAHAPVAAPARREALQPRGERTKARRESVSGSPPYAVATATWPLARHSRNMNGDRYIKNRESVCAKIAYRKGDERKPCDAQPPTEGMRTLEGAPLQAEMCG